MEGAYADRGAVTVEAAMALFTLVTALAVGVGGIAAVSDQLRCTDAAREAARLAARGDHERAHEVVGRIAPNGARLDLESTAAGITATVWADPAGGLLPGVRLTASAFAVPEPGVSDERAG